jgi:hypothetical protein
MYRAVKLLLHNFLECIVLQQLALAGLAQQSRRLVLILLRGVRQAEHASRKCISRQGHPLFARLGLAVRLLRQLLVLRRTVMQAGIQQLLSVLRL